jgi:acyl-homoserine-lactone acylase
MFTLDKIPLKTMKKLLIFLFISLACSSKQKDEDLKRYKDQAARVTIIRDSWGIPHIYGKTDADAVFGLMYAQCEESFERVERNYLLQLGRMTEVEGEAYLLHDLKMKLLYDSTAAIAEYQNSPGWLKSLLHAFADGINYYLLVNKNVQPKAIKKFEPWYPLMFTDGAYIAVKTGGLTMQDLNEVYGDQLRFSAVQKKPLPDTEATGSNAFAIAPIKTESNKALLYINPHVSFDYRMEAHINSEEGLNAYGAVTWGQFFIFQGFGETHGWMHTSSQADVADVYEEKISKTGNDFFYNYSDSLKPLITKKHSFAIKAKGSKTITTYATHHGPVMGKKSENLLTLKENSRSLNGLIQSWQRMKTKNFEEFQEVMRIRANQSTNTLYADKDGTIAYWHGNFIPKRNSMYNWNLPVDGSVKETEWENIHDLKDIVQLKNPGEGWLQNCNSTPFSVAGFNSINKNNYSNYMAPEEENFRSVLAIQELEKENAFNLEKLIALGYNHYLGAFDSLLPPLLNAYDNLAPNHPLKNQLAEPVTVLKTWNKKSSAQSVATTLAVLWAYNIFSNADRYPNSSTKSEMEAFAVLSRSIPGDENLNFLLETVKSLQSVYKTWKVTWGELNRFQKLPGSLQPSFDHAKESLPVGMASAIFGSLPAFETQWKDIKGYGVAGNSFVAAVEFGEKVRAKAITPGGQSFTSSSKHFSDQAAMYISGSFRDVFFYKDDVMKNSERQYHPGEKH